MVGGNPLPSGDPSAAAPYIIINTPIKMTTALILHSKSGAVAIARRAWPLVNVRLLKKDLRQRLGNVIFAI